MVGLFINTLPLRVNVSGDAFLGDWLKQLRTQWLDMREHEHTPLIQIQKWSEVPAGQPLFESILMFENYELSRRLQAQGGKWGKRRFRLYEQTGYPLTLTVYSDSQLCLQIEFDRRRFEEATIERMVCHLKVLLQGMLSGPTQRLLDLEYLTQQERSELLVRWNSTRADYSRRATLHGSFEEQVKLSSGSIAVEAGDQKLTYSELNSRANRLAHHLLRRGIRPEDLVGICVDRSVDMVIAMLAVLKSGAAYVPLDPAFPKERLAQILDDAQVKVLLVQRHLVSVLPIVRTDVLYLSAPEIAYESAEAPCSTAQSSNLAYVIFTSGSTGRPKGVQIEHRAVMNFMESMSRKPGLSSEDTLLAVTTFSFDIAGLEVFLPLLKGARVVIADKEVAIDGRRLARLVESSGATVMQATPTTWRMLLEAGWAGRENIKLLCGGEAFPVELAKELIPRCSSLWNMYGPTETTIWSTIWRVRTAQGSIPIGQPIANTDVYILDRHLQPLPIGVPGELFIGGEGVARGYWRRPDLTAERFIANPFKPHNGERLYRTGDLCRWRADGSIECLGRNDQQVKIRGYRMELGDIETALATHPLVKQALATVQQTAVEKKLVAFITAKTDMSAAPGELRKHLIDRLPDYMVPSSFVTLDRMPLTPNGKIDRNALPTVSSANEDHAHAEWPTPADPMENMIASVLRRVLAIENIGSNSNFFDLGADSLSILRVAVKLEELLGREVVVIDLFRNPTVKSLAEYLRGKEGSGQQIRTKEQISAHRNSVRLRLQKRLMRVE
ncbi:MAG: non-ribosomal peptide synthase [Acidobacteria bacterium]|nr:MAG: non-ribosomal peptide synthase [Acidobacteriota bacterium]